MRGNRKMLRLLAIVVALVMLATACGDDGGTNTSPFSPGSDDTGSDDTGSDDTGSGDADGDTGADDSDGDTGSDDTGSDDTGADDADDDTGSDDDPSPIVVPGGIDCVALGEAMDAAGDIVATDPISGSGSDNLEQSFAESRAQFEALKSQAPELADDVDAVLAGMDVLGELFASVDWDTANLATDPTQVAGFLEILSDPAFLGMTSAFTNIGFFIGNTCA